MLPCSSFKAIGTGDASMTARSLDSLRAGSSSVRLCSVMSGHRPVSILSMPTPVPSRAPLRPEIFRRFREETYHTGDDQRGSTGVRRLLGGVSIPAKLVRRLDEDNEP